MQDQPVGDFYLKLHCKALVSCEALFSGTGVIPTERLSHRVTAPRRYDDESEMRMASGPATWSVTQSAGIDPIQGESRAGGW